MNRSRRWTAMFAALVAATVASCGDSGSPFRRSGSRYARRGIGGGWHTGRRGAGRRAWQTVGVPTAFSDAGAIFARPWTRMADGGRLPSSVPKCRVSCFPSTCRTSTGRSLQRRADPVADRADNLLPDMAGYRVSIQPKR